MHSLVEKDINQGEESGHKNVMESVRDEISIIMSTYDPNDRNVSKKVSFSILVWWMNIYNNGTDVFQGNGCNSTAAAPRFFDNLGHIKRKTTKTKNT